MGCDEFATETQRKIGGERHTFLPPHGGYVFPAGTYVLGPADEAWTHHTVVVEDGRVYDEYVPAGGMLVEEWKKQWGALADDIDFGF